MIPFTQEAGAALLEELSVDYPQLRDFSLKSNRVRKNSGSPAIPLPQPDAVWAWR